MRNIHRRKSRSHRARNAGLLLVAALYLVTLLANFLAPYDYREQTRLEPNSPPSAIRFVDKDGQFHLRPFIYEQKLVDARNFAYQEETGRMFPLGLFVRGASYELFGVIPTEIHLFGLQDFSPDAPRVRVLGTDHLGRDRFSRLLYAIRFSLIVSPVGTILACVIGVIFGAVSGYAARAIDAVMMGIADTVISLPTLVLILAARAAFPLELPPFTAAVLLIAIFAAIGWADMARLTRGLVYSTKKRDYVLAARSIGLSEPRILWRHILPNIQSPLLIQATLMLPVFLLAEVALSFLGVGVQEPEPSLGNMLSSAGDLSLLRNSPFLMLFPAIPIFLFVLGIRLVGWHRQPDRL